MSTTNDLLYSAFEEYRKLTNIKYIFVIKHASNIATLAETRFLKKTNSDFQKEIWLHFRPEDFYHFTGLRHSSNVKLSGYDKNSATKRNFYDDVKNHKVTYTDICNINIVDHPNEIDSETERILSIINIENYLDKSNELRDYDGFLYKKNKFGSYNKKEAIKSANCYIRCPEESSGKIKNYFFSLETVVDSSKNNPKTQAYVCNPCSIVCKNNDEEEDFRINHDLITVLVKKKDYITGIEETLYIYPAYLADKPDQIEKEKTYLLLHESVKFIL